MNAKKCDRCGKFYVEVEANAFQAAFHKLNVATQRLLHGETFDLFEQMKNRVDFCTDCEDSLRKWCYKEAEQ